MVDRKLIQSFKTVIFFVFLAVFLLFIGGCSKKYEIEFEKINYQVNVGESITISPIVKLKGKEVEQELVYESNNPNIATYVDGVVTGVAKGTTKIKAMTTDKKFFAEANIIVNEIKESEYAIIYELNGGINDPENYKKYTKSLLPIDLLPATKDGYNFIGWYKSSDFSGKKVDVLDEDTTGMITLYARYEPIIYQIEYVLNGGENHLNNLTEFTVDVLPIILKAPQHNDENMVFKGWYDNADFNGTALTEIAVNTTNNITLYAKWEEVAEAHYKINYHLDGGVNNSKNKLDFTIEELPLSIYSPTKEGYEFLGWYDNEDFTGDAITNIISEPTKDIDLYARWKKVEVEYSITYVLNGGVNNLSNPTKFKEENLPIQLYGATRAGFEFKGWYLDKDFAGEVISIIPKGTNNNLTLYAKFDELVATTYDIIYVLNGGVNHIDNPSKYEIDKLPITLKDATKEEHKFLGWYHESDFSGPKVVGIPVGSKGNITLYAKFESEVVADDYTITYHLDGGTWNYSQSEKDSMLVEFLVDFYEYVNPSISLAAFIHGEGKSSGFEGRWHRDYQDFLYKANTKDKDGSIEAFINQPKYYDKWFEFFNFLDALISEQNPTQDLWGSTYVGYMRINSYFVGDTFKPELLARVPDLTPKITKYNQTTPTIYLRSPRKANYRFAGWYDNSSFAGEAITQITKGSSGNKNLYAKWEALSDYNITYNLNGGSLSSSKVKFNALDLPVFLLNPTKDQSQFLGWYLNSDLSGNRVTELTKLENVTLYAKWSEAEEYKITYYLDGGMFEFSSKQEMATKFFGDLYDYIKPEESLNDFIHGVGNTSGFDGLWHQDSRYNGKVYAANKREIDENQNIFIMQPEYFSKWIPFFDFIEQLMNERGGDPKFWASPFTGRVRIRDYFADKTFTSEQLQRMPNYTPVTKYTQYSDTIILPIPNKTGKTFAGWYTNSSFTGNAVTTIPKGSTGNKNFYAKWE